MPFSWDRLIDLIDEGAVVPVVGSDVLQIDVDGVRTPLYTHLARGLAAKLGVAFDDGESPSLSVVADRYLAQPGAKDDNIYAALNRLVKDTAKFNVPESLRKLAEIRPLRLFVTTTFDPMLARALNEVRYAGQPATNVISASFNAGADVPREMLDDDRPIVFHLFGKVSGLPEYAVTEEDTLEFVHSLQSGRTRAPNLFDELDQKRLLLLGNSFGDWLARFFIRGAKVERFWKARRRSDFLADDRLSQERTLRSFLERFSADMNVFTDGGAIQFIDNLYAEWKAVHPDDQAPPVPTAQVFPPAKSGGVFLNYASEDREIALRVRQLLDGNGIDVWMDVDGLLNGDRWDGKIRVALRQSAIFMPILSKRSLVPGDRHFRREWDFALDIEKGLPANARYIMPLVADDVSRRDEAIPLELRETDWEEIDAVFPKQEWLELVRSTIRVYRRERERFA